MGVNAPRGDGESVERDVPNQFAPAGERQAGFKLAGDLSGIEGIGYGLGAWLGFAQVFGNGDQSLGAVIDDARGESVDAHKAKAAKDTLRPEVSGKEILVAETILQGEDECILVKKRRQDVGQDVVGGGLEGDDDEIAGTDGCGIGMSVDLGKFEVTSMTANVQAVLADVVEIAAHQEMHIVTILGKAGTVVATEGATADDGNAGGWVE